MMQLHIIAICQQMPDWVNRATESYLKRLPAHWHIKLISIACQKRTRQANLTKIQQLESQALFAVVPVSHQIIALDRKGIHIDSVNLANTLIDWQQFNQNTSLLIGGPEGIAPDYLNKAHARWSLSSLTLPHPLVRIIIIEQLYRAWTIQQQHPYHR